MSSDPIDDGQDAEVVPLRAADAGTEARLAETPGPAYTTIEDGQEQRRPVIPERWRTREARRRHLQLLADRHGHAAAYHGLRLHSYTGKTLWYALRGVFLVTGRLITWWHVPDIRLLESQAARNGLVADHLRLHKTGKETRKARGLILLAGLALAVTGLAGLVALHRWWAWALLALVAVPALARTGRPANKPIVQPAVLPQAVQPPTQDVITRALGSLGIPGIDRWLRDGRELVFPSPVREDGPGWRAEVDLPYGVTATQVIERRAQLASGLRRPLGAVWPEPVTSEHEGRLEVFVGRSDLAKMRAAPWPLLRSGDASVFDPVPFGTDPRGRVVRAPLVFHSWLIGSIPRQGKTATARVLACAAALDPLCELWVHELKGSGDLDPLEKVAHRFISGVDDESIGYAAASLRLLRREVEERAERLKALPRELCPDKRVTRQIAARRPLRLHPVACVIDECQNLFAHSQHGKSAGQDAEFVCKIGPAFGVFLILATQRPDKASLPTGISGNVSDRFCLKVMGQTENDMILGTSAYKNGVRATTFRPEVDAGIGYYIGGTAPQVVRTYYLDLPATERIANRARAVREAAGTLTGSAAGLVGEPSDILSDTLRVLGDDTGLHWELIAERLRTQLPERHADATADSVSAQCRDRGVPSVDVRYPPGRAGANRKGARRADVERALRDGQH